MKTEIENALRCLQDGGVILYPTDTIWGVGCDATNESAVARLLEIKSRPGEKGFIVMVESDARLNRHVEEIPAVAWDLIDVEEKPLTIIYPKGVGLAKDVCAPDGTVAIRMVRDEFCEKLIRRLNRPMVSTSANIHGMETPKSFRDIDPAILDAVDYTVNLRQSETIGHRPSSIIQLHHDGEIKIIR